MITVKLSTNFPHWPLIRQTPGGLGEWGNCRFVVNQEIEECDFWVVLDGLTRADTTRCDRSNTLLVTCEPPDVKTYPSAFVRQFCTVLTSHRELEHSHVVFGQQGLPWMFGGHLEPTSLTWSQFMSFEEIENYLPEKHRLASIVASKNKATSGHVIRDRFIDEVKRSLGDRVDVFGLGYSGIADKLDAIGPYRYHIAIENSCVPDYWTEKLADAYLGRAYPIYSGCPNLEAYFPADSYERLDIRDPIAAAKRVSDIIASNIDDERRSVGEEARRKVLYEHNVFAMLERLIERLRHDCPKRAEPLTLWPLDDVAARRPALLRWLQGGIRRIAFAQRKSASPS